MQSQRSKCLLFSLRINLTNNVGFPPELVALVLITDPSVRTELMEQVPHIAMFCHECPEMFGQPISTYILPVIVKYLMDNNNLVSLFHDIMRYET